MKAKKKSKNILRISILVVILLVLPLALYLLINPKEEKESDAAWLPNDPIALGTSRIRISGKVYDCAGQLMKNVYIGVIWNNSIREEDTTDENGVFHTSSNINFSEFGVVAGRDVNDDKSQRYFTRVDNPKFTGVTGTSLDCNYINCNYDSWRTPGNYSGRKHYFVGVNKIWTDDYFNKFFVSKETPAKGFDFRIANCPNFGINITNPSNNAKISRSKGTLIKAIVENLEPSSATTISLAYMPFKDKNIIDLNCQDTSGKWKNINKVNRNNNVWQVMWKFENGQNFPSTNGFYLITANLVDGNNKCTGNPAYDSYSGKNCSPTSFNDWCNLSGNREDSVMWKIVEIVD